MVSAEQSGARDSVEPGTGETPSEQLSPSSTANAPTASRALIATLIKFTIGAAAAIAVMVAAFALYDRGRSVEEAEVRLGLLASQVADAIDGLDLISAQIALDGTDTSGVGGGVALHLTDAGGRLIATTGNAVTVGTHFDRAALSRGMLVASAPAPGDFGSLTVMMPVESALTGTGWRLFYAVAGGLVLVGALAAGVFYAARQLRQRAREDAEAAAEAAKAERRQPMSPGKATILNNVGFGLARWDEDGLMVWCNPAYRELLGIPANAKLSGQTYDAVLSEATRPLFYKPIDEEDGTRRTEVVCDNGLFVLVEERVVEDGGVLTVATDITEHKHSDHALEAAKDEQRNLARRYHEEKLRAEAASRAKTAFLAHLSHDIRTPLNHIIGFAELIQHQLFGPIGDERYAAYVHDIKGSGERLLASFAQIFELAQLEAGNAPVRIEQLSASSVFGAIESRFAERAQRAGLDFSVSIPEDVSFAGDKQGITRLLCNLVDNAIKFTPAGGSVKIAAWAAEDGLVLEVTDTGIGMAEDRVALLSQPFILGESAFGPNSAGMGLGLAIARAIAELSGGSLVIDSTPALGTTVAVALPRSTAAGGAQAAA